MAWNNPYPETPEQRLTRQFYQWEERGRGWQVWPYPVELEPPFTPFFSYSTPPATKIDDGRRSTFLSSLVEGKIEKVRPSKKTGVSFTGFHGFEREWL
ncbi:hypothetical protein MYX82_01205 [Acidobacteria bacterium AH-259-D05]|nr:hypothetical protein [Acidobacteria bacterium AH-259-D05]